MIYQYDLKGQKLEIDLAKDHKTAKVKLDHEFIYEFENQKTLNAGKKIDLDSQPQLFLRLINEQEGFSVMLNDVHILTSAGHPIKLLKRTLLPLSLAFLIIAIQFIYIIWDTKEKGELEIPTLSVKTFSYFFYYLVLLVMTLIGYLLVKKGNWRGVLLGALALLTNFIITQGLGLYFNTGFNGFIWTFLTIHLILLIMLYTHSPVIKYVSYYSKKISAKK